MMKSQKFPICALLIGLCFLVTICEVKADDTYIGGIGSNVTALKNEQIEMAYEKLILEFVDRSWNIDCYYEFKNTGDAVNIPIGFPIIIDEFTEMDNKGKFISPIKNFKTYVNDKEVQVVIKNDKDNETRIFYSYNVKFDKDETVKIRHTYSHGDSGTSGSESFVDFILKTGANWKGPIKKLDIEMRNIYSISFIDSTIPGHILEDNKITWTLKDFEPDKDFHVRYTYQSPSYVGWKMMNLIQTESKKDILSKHKNEYLRFINQFVASYEYVKEKEGEKGVEYFMSMAADVHGSYVFLLKMCEIFNEEINPTIKLKLKRIALSRNLELLNMTPDYLTDNEVEKKYNEIINFSNRINLKPNRKEIISNLNLSDCFVFDYAIEAFSLLNESENSTVQQCYELLFSENRNESVFAAAFLANYGHKAEKIYECLDKAIIESDFCPRILQKRPYNSIDDGF